VFTYLPIYAPVEVSVERYLGMRKKPNTE